MTRQYLFKPRRRFYVSVDADRVGPDFEAEKGDHPYLELNAMPSIGLVHSMLNAANEGGEVAEETYKESLLVFLVDRLGGDWTLAATRPPESNPPWPSLNEEDAIKTRLKTLKQILAAPEVRDAGEMAHGFIKLTEDERGNSSSPSGSSDSPAAEAK